MNIVDFSEGILGLDRVLPDGRQARDVVAKCLRKIALNQNPHLGTIMFFVASRLESGSKPQIEVIRLIGEDRLREAKELFLADEKEEART